MANKLKNLHLTSVDLVGAGANQEADICLYKSLDAPQTISKSAPDRFETIQEVNKFNPFHDSKGWFASANGFKSYSANPNTKAGAMAISRSVAAGHGKTQNVHRNSSRADLKADANALARGNKTGRGRSGSTVLTGTVERASGLKGASQTGATWHQMNQQSGKTISQQAPKPKQQTQPKQTQQQQTPKQTQQQTQTTNHKMVNGKDLMRNVTQAEKLQLVHMTTSDLMKKQGFDGKPQVVSADEFKKLAKANGNVMVRTVWSNDDAEANARLHQLKHGDFYIAEGQSNRFGNGMYVAEQKPTAYGLARAHRDSIPYGHRNSYDRTIYMTIDKSAKRVRFSDLKKMAVRDGVSVSGWGGKSMYEGDIGSYAVSKGYDVIEGTKNGSKMGYSVVLNRSKIILCDETSTYASRQTGNRIPSSIAGM